MRIVAEIPHPQIKITVFAWNVKYIIKLEAGPYEQVYKISESDVAGIDQIKELLSPDFIRKCIERFNHMHSDFAEQCQIIIH